MTRWMKDLRFTEVRYKSRVEKAIMNRIISTRGTGPKKYGPPTKGRSRSKIWMTVILTVW